MKLYKKLKQKYLRLFRNSRPPIDPPTFEGHLLYNIIFLYPDIPGLYLYQEESELKKYFARVNGVGIKDIDITYNGVSADKTKQVVKARINNIKAFEKAMKH